MQATIERTSEPVREQAAAAQGGRRPSGWSRPLLLCAAGLVVLSLAGLVYSEAGGRGGGTPAPPVAATDGPQPAVSPAGLTIQGPGDITVLPMTYEPGQTSGWHTHRGIHAVAILSGTLTVYDQACVGTAYSAGQPYIGGQELHLVRNEGDAPVQMIVTYLNPAAGGDGAAAVSPPRPPACGITS